MRCVVYVHLIALQSELGVGELHQEACITMRLWCIRPALSSTPSHGDNSSTCFKPSYMWREIRFSLVRTNFGDKWRSLGLYISLADLGHGVFWTYELNAMWEKFCIILNSLNLGCLHLVACVRSGDGGLFRLRNITILFIIIKLINVSVVRPSSGRNIFPRIYSTDNGSVVFRNHIKKATNSQTDQRICCQSTKS
jgi:hypothetical protein